MRAFAQERLAPFAAEWDRNKTFRPRRWELGELGAMGVCVPEQWGGAGMDYMSLVLMLEEIAAGDGATSTIVSVQNSLACGIPARYGSEAQKPEWLKPWRAAKIGCFCLTEPHTGSDAAAIRTRATRDGDDFVINGVKQFTSSGKRQRGGRIVFAVTDPSRRQEGDFLLPGADRDAGLPGRADREQDGPACLRHRADRLRRLPRAGLGTCSARKGRATRSHCPIWKPAASASRRRPSAWRARAYEASVAMPGTASPSASPSSSTRRSTWAGRHGDPARRRAADGLARRAAQGRRPACLTEASMANVRLEMAEKVCSAAIQILAAAAAPERPRSSASTATCASQIYGRQRHPAPGHRSRHRGRLKRRCHGGTPWDPAGDQDRGIRRARAGADGHHAAGRPRRRYCASSARRSPRARPQSCSIRRSTS